MKKQTCLFILILLLLTSCKDKTPDVTTNTSLVNSVWKMEYDKHIDLVGNIKIQFLADSTVICLDENVKTQQTPEKDKYTSKWKEQNDSVFISLEVWDLYNEEYRYKRYLMYLKKETNKFSGKSSIQIGLGGGGASDITGIRIK